MPSVYVFAFAAIAVTFLASVASILIHGDE
jgi:hypothetical protein